MMPDDSQLLVPWLRRALRGAVFPLSREQLVLLARENETPSSVLSLLSDLTPPHVTSWDALLEALERTQQVGRPAPLAPEADETRR